MLQEIGNQSDSTSETLSDTQKQELLEKFRGTEDSAGQETQQEPQQEKPEDSASPQEIPEPKAERPEEETETPQAGQEASDQEEELTIPEELLQKTPEELAKMVVHNKRFAGKHATAAKNLETENLQLKEALTNFAKASYVQPQQQAAPTATPEPEEEDVLTPKTKMEAMGLIRWFTDNNKPEEAMKVQVELNTLMFQQEELEAKRAEKRKKSEEDNRLRSQLQETRTNEITWYEQNIPKFPEEYRDAVLSRMEKILDENPAYRLLNTNYMPQISLEAVIQEGILDAVIPVKKPQESKAPSPPFPTPKGTDRSTAASKQEENYAKYGKREVDDLLRKFRGE